MFGSLGIFYPGFTEPMFNFIENAVRNGESVLVSALFLSQFCLASVRWVAGFAAIFHEDSIA